MYNFGCFQVLPTRFLRFFKSKIAVHKLNIVVAVPDTFWEDIKIKIVTLSYSLWVFPAEKCLPVFKVVKKHTRPCKVFGKPVNQMSYKHYTLERANIITCNWHFLHNFSWISYIAALSSCLISSSSHNTLLYRHCSRVD